MWLSKQIMQQQELQDAATLGTVSIGGRHAAVVTDGEKRQACVIAPGGYYWQPKKADGVLLVRSNEDYVTGVPIAEAAGLAPGEIRIFSDGAEITLENSGAIRIRGAVDVAGTLMVNGREVMLK